MSLTLSKYDKDVNAGLKHGQAMYQSGIRNGKELILSTLELKLLDSKSVTIFDVFNAIDELRKELKGEMK